MVDHWKVPHSGRPTIPIRSYIKRLKFGGRKVDESRKRVDFGVVEVIRNEFEYCNGLCESCVRRKFWRSLCDVVRSLSVVFSV